MARGIHSKKLTCVRTAQAIRSKKLASVRAARAIRSKKFVSSSNGSSSPFKKIVSCSNGSSYPAILNNLSAIPTARRAIGVKKRFISLLREWFELSCSKKFVNHSVTATLRVTVRDTNIAAV